MRCNSNANSLSFLEFCLNSKVKRKTEQLSVWVCNASPTAAQGYDVFRLLLASSRSSSVFSLCPLNTGLCEHAISWQGPISILAVTFSSELLTVVYAGYESGTAANFLWGHFSIIIPVLRLLPLKCCFPAIFCLQKWQGGSAILSMKFERVV